MLRREYKKWGSKILVGLMGLAMASVFVPKETWADDTSNGAVVLSGDSDSSGLELTKTATLEDDGTYTIKLESYATGEIKTYVKEQPTDIVLVLDVSGSMDDDFTYVTEWNYVEDTKTAIKDCPDTTLYHKCPDGTWGTITWTQTGRYGVGTYRYVCDHCKATRKWSSPLRKTLGTTKDDGDPWNLYQYTQDTEEKPRIEALQEAAKTFIENVATKNAGITDENEQHRISIVKFASEEVKNNIGNDTYNESGYKYNYTQTVADLTVVNENTKVGLLANIDSLNPGGATAADKGLQLAANNLRNSDNNRAKVVILFTDGDPTYGNSFQNTVASNAVTTAKQLKDAGTTVYTIGTFTGANPEDVSNNSNKYMNAVSSNYPSATVTDNSNFTVELGAGGNNGYYKGVSDSAELNNIFTKISEDIGTTTVNLDANAVTKDILADGFVLPDGISEDNITVETVKYKGRDKDGNRVFYETGNTLSEAEITIDKGKNIVEVKEFDYAGKCLVDGTETDKENDFTAAKQGEKLVISIPGVEATDVAITDDIISTNNINSGIYSDATEKDLVARFPQPQTQLSKKSYVLDYAKEANLTDMPNVVTSINAEGMKKFSSANTEITMQYGKATLTSYVPTTTIWNGYDSFYAFGTWNTKPENITTGNNTWTKVSVIPANNVYYEDDFITSENSGTVGIEYTGNWEIDTDGTSSRNTETANTENHGGWQNTDLADDATYSDGSAHKTVASNDNVASATFTFTGTGVDVYSRTDMKTGTVYAVLKGTSDKSITKRLIVDNESASGTYYQIPTVSFAELPHGTYTVTIKVTTAAEGRYTYYLDGIRVYNPLSGEQEEDSTVSDAYKEEVGAAFIEVRDILVDAQSLSQNDNAENDNAENDNVAGAVFIDKTIDNQTGQPTSEIGTYEIYGPKNEVYLEKDQSIAFVLSVGEGTKYQIGLKSPTGQSTSAEITNGSVKSSVAINAASDLYYTITPTDSGLFIITNKGENLLSITKLKTIGDGGVETASVMSLLAYADEFDTLETVAYEETEQEESEITEPSESTDQETKDEPGDVVIDNPEPEPEPAQPSLKEWFNKLFDSFRKWFK